MDIREARDAKRELEEKINELCNEFSSMTGLTVDGIDLLDIKTHTETPRHFVRCEMKL
jgi:hypothetical protein